MNTSKSLYELVCEFLHPDKPDNVTAKEMLDLMEPGLVPAIVEAVEGIYGDSDGLREFAGLNLIKPVPKVPSKRKEP